jgi:hypothetical protein
LHCPSSHTKKSMVFWKLDLPLPSRGSGNRQNLNLFISNGPTRVGSLSLFHQPLQTSMGSLASYDGQCSKFQSQLSLYSTIRIFKSEYLTTRRK